MPTECTEAFAMMVPIQEKCSEWKDSLRKGALDSLAELVLSWAKRTSHEMAAMVVTTESVERIAFIHMDCWITALDV